MVRLGVNVDHVATIREARKTNEPDPVLAASLAELGGADSIVVHLREDRRHIQDRDLRLLRQTVKTRLNLEMGMSDEIIAIAIEVRPDQVTLVPERRQELTTEGGLDVVKQRDRIRDVVASFKKHGIPVSLFIDPVVEHVQEAKRLGASFIELHTGKFVNTKTTDERLLETRALAEAARMGRNLGLGVAAGHGITYVTAPAVAKIPNIEEYNIGHTIVARAVFVGMEQAVREMKRLLEA